MQLVFYAFFFLVPLAFYPLTSELFEFNKLIVMYFAAVAIAALWLTKCILAKKFIFRRTILDIPIILFLLSQLISTFLSIDMRTSIFGYYSRWNGGLITSIAYALLYWAYVSNMDRKKTLVSVYILTASTVLVSAYGVLEHLGIDKNLWVQDVQNRVFSSFGQPNWLAAWLVALMPLGWALALRANSKNETVKIRIKNVKFWVLLLTSVLFFATLLFTKSRSGIIGFVTASAIFWGLSFLNSIKSQKLFNFFSVFLLFNILYLLLTVAFGTPWTPGITGSPKTPPPVTGPALETGGTESGEIRKIVWKGAVDVWKHYPLVGTGPETFAYSYYSFRPVEHNLTSEWDFLYNKAHNEYLNYLANTGAVGLGAYLLVIGTSIYLIIKNSKTQKLQLGVFAGYASLLVTNFFGFSVVPTQLQLFLFPAFAVGLAVESRMENGEWKKETKINTSQKTLLALILLATFYLLLTIARYWYADYLYAKGKMLHAGNHVTEARKALVAAAAISPREGLYWDELSQIDADIAVALFQGNNKSQAADFADKAAEEEKKVAQLSPANLNFKKSQAKLYIKLSQIDLNYLLRAEVSLMDAANQAPTDAKIAYNLGLAKARLGELDEAVKILTAAKNLKPNYKEARFALAVLLKKQGKREQAKEELEFILANIDPGDPTVKTELEGINH